MINILAEIWVFKKVKYVKNTYIPIDLSRLGELSLYLYHPELESNLSLLLNQIKL